MECIGGTKRTAFVAQSGTYRYKAELNRDANALMAF